MMRLLVLLAAIHGGASLALAAPTYGQLNAATNLILAPKVVDYDGRYRPIKTLTESQANSIGYKLVEQIPPPCASNEYAVAVGWAETNRIYRTYEIRTIVPAPRKFSKLKIYGAIISLPESNGTTAWAKVQSWLEAKTINGINGWMAFQLAQEISEDHPLFAPLAAEAQALLGLTDVQFAALLNACILED